jgi:hypothetical protein
MLLTVTPDDYETFVRTPARELEADGWGPTCRLIHEFSVAPLGETEGDAFTQVKTMDEAIENIFAMGFGPCPLYRRSGVLVLGFEDHADEYAEAAGDDEDDNEQQQQQQQKKKKSRRIGCIVPHSRSHKHGCACCEFKQCYLCPQNPFYEVRCLPSSYPGQRTCTRLGPAADWVNSGLLRQGELRRRATQEPGPHHAHASGQGVRGIFPRPLLGSVKGTF